MFDAEHAVARALRTSRDVDPTATGYRGAPYQFPIERGKIREMARAAVSNCPAYFSSENPPVTPTFLKLAQFLWEPSSGSATERIGFDPVNTPLHASQEFEFHGRLPCAGDELTAQSLVESITSRSSRRFGTATWVTITTQFQDRDGNVVATARTTSVAVPARGEDRD